MSINVRNNPEIELFVSYSHENATWFAKLRPLLKFDMPMTSAYAWHDQELKAGDRWDDEIRQKLQSMHVFVCLLSYEFRSSDYIREVELKLALERNQQEQVEIVPILLYPMDLQNDCPELHAFNPLPAWGKSWWDYVQNGGHYQGAHKEIRDGLRQAIEKVRNKLPTNAR